MDSWELCFAGDSSKREELHQVLPVIATDLLKLGGQDKKERCM